MIGESAFEGCTNLKDMVGADFIGKNAYNGCENLTQVIVTSKTYISNGAFLNCPQLIRIELEDFKAEKDTFDSDNKIVVVSDAFQAVFPEYNIRYTMELDDANGIYYNKIGYVEYLNGFLINCEREVSGNVNIEGNPQYAGEIKTIGRKSFYGCTGINSVQIPNTVKTIETKAFYKCEGMNKVEIPGSVTEIAEDAFAECPNVVFYVAEGSYAQKYAKTHGISYITENDLKAPAKPNYKKVTGNVATASLKKVEGADGYEVIIGPKGCDKKGNYWQRKETKGLSVAFNYVRHGTFYSYVRAYKVENGEKMYSDWSDGKSVFVQAFTPSAPKITRVQNITVSGSTVTVQFKASNNCVGYDAVLGKGKNSEKPTKYAYTAKNQKSPRIVFKNVKKGTYYIGAHSFNRTGTTKAKVFSKWSNMVKVTVK